MHVAVCVKQIPDPAAPGELDPDTNTLKRAGKLVMDDSDNYGVEMALQLVTQAGGGQVTVISMAPNQEVKGVKDALAMGADKGIVVTDDALKGSDALSTAKVLAACVKRAGDVDLVLAATESTDGSTITDERQTEAGYDEVECPLPALVTVTAGVVEPRYPSFKAIMAAKNKPIDLLTLADLGVEASAVGWAGARQEITEVKEAEARTAGEIVEDDGDGHMKIVSFLEKLRVV
jgi:electron transfer flavoprotein beta subunit